MEYLLNMNVRIQLLIKQKIIINYTAELILVAVYKHSKAILIKWLQLSCAFTGRAKPERDDRILRMKTQEPYPTTIASPNRIRSVWPWTW